MSLFSKLTGLDNKSDKNKLEIENEEINFFDEELPKKNNKIISTSYHKQQSDSRKEDLLTDACATENKKIIDKNKESIEDEWKEKDYEEGELSIDVYQDKNDILVKSTIAGVKPEDIDISVNNDMLTIRGKREHEETIDEKNYYYKECYWGNFSRSIILPCEVKTDKITAKLKNGVLTVRLPKTKAEKKVAIKVVEE